MKATLTLTMAAVLALGPPLIGATGAPSAGETSSVDPREIAAHFAAQLRAHPEQAVLLPKGSMIVGAVGETGIRLDVVPIPSEPTSMIHQAGGQADCENDVLASDPWSPQAYGVPTNTGWPLRVNTASRGECAPEVHAGPVTAFQFRTQGDHWGWMRVEDADGSLRIGCSPAGSVLGVGLGDQWRTTFDGADMTCFIEKYGADPSEFTAWEASVTNHHFGYGSTFLAIN